MLLRAHIGMLDGTHQQDEPSLMVLAEEEYEQLDAATRRIILLCLDGCRLRGDGGSWCRGPHAERWRNKYAATAIVTIPIASIAPISTVSDSIDAPSRKTPRNTTMKYRSGLSRVRR